jgi:hypothetical protein
MVIFPVNDSIVPVVAEWWRVILRVPAEVPVFFVINKEEAYLQACLFSSAEQILSVSEVAKNQPVYRH